MPRRHFKPDSSFFNKIVIGAVGANAVRKDLSAAGFNPIELERGATDAKIWREVKRKRVRIPDLVCTRTGLRIESRAKTKPALQMSHTPGEAERAWDFGMIDEDWIAFPVCRSSDEAAWIQGSFEEDLSYFRERVAEHWEADGHINYVPVGEFRRVRHARGSRKGVVEASEFSIEWAGIFSTRSGPVRYVKPGKVSIENEEGRAYTWTVPEGLDILVGKGDMVVENQLFASAVRPISPSETDIPELSPDQLRSRFLESKERTMRFTGVKLARIRGEPQHESMIRDIATDTAEDLYVRLEALVYMSSVLREPVADVFEEYLQSGEDETALEAVISVGEVADGDAVAVLGDLLLDRTRPFFLRSAAAWALGKIPGPTAPEVLIRAFGDQTLEIREEALRGLVSLGPTARSSLLAGMHHDDGDVAAGCAEALRQHRELSSTELREVLTSLQGDDPSHWGVWLIGSLPSEAVAPALHQAQGLNDEVHYALSVLWSFGRSWISQNWERDPTAQHWRRRLLEE